MTAPLLGERGLGGDLGFVKGLFFAPKLLPAAAVTGVVDLFNA